MHFTLFFAMENRRWVILPAQPAHPAHPAHPAEIRKWSLEAWSGASLRAGGEDDVSSTETPSNDDADDGDDDIHNNSTENHVSDLFALDCIQIVGAIV